MEEIMYQRNNGYIMKYISKGDYYIDIQGTSFRKDDYVLTGKYSPNIIDLIEVGDWGIMNCYGLIVKKVITQDDILELKTGNYQLLKILTKERFESESYEV